MSEGNKIYFARIINGIVERYIGFFLVVEVRCQVVAYMKENQKSISITSSSNFDEYRSV